MCTQQLSRPLQNVSSSKSWQEMFPNPQLTEQTSVTFLKKLVALAISNITYLRNIFPEGAFADKSLEGLNLKVLRDDGTFPAVAQIIRWIRGCFEALDHKYLRQLIIGIYNDPTNPNNVLETYSFHFSYTNKILAGCTYYQNDGKNKREITTEKFVSAEETIRQTLSLFRHCILCTHSLKPLPQDSLINMRLLYYDDVTPENYEPPGFKASSVSSYTFVNSPILLNLGETKTPWHGMKLLLATDASDFEVAGETPSTTEKTNASNSDTQQGQKNTTCQLNESTALQTPIYQPRTSTAINTPGNAMVPNLTSPQLASANKNTSKSQNSMVPTISPAQPTSAVSTTGSSYAEENGLEGQEVKIRCPCGSTVDAGLLMVCKKCRLWQHANCFKILTEDNVPRHHICELCNYPSKPCTDVSLPPIMPNERKEICLYRRALGLCNESYRLGVCDLVASVGMDNDTAFSIMSKLDKDGVFKLTNKRSKGKFRLINKPNLKKKILPIYFSNSTISEVSQTQDDNEVLAASPCQNDLTEQEIPEEIEILTENLSISNSRNTGNKYIELSYSKGKKRPLPSLTVQPENNAVEGNEHNATVKKKFKVSVPEDYLH